ncbi:MAG: hypothetical protein IIB95_12720 [Candidatus Marinimicrobia bacterium]|nr:hypothetical protein [Candidatus Neomarinimicrobiota bacterium]
MNRITSPASSTITWATLAGFGASFVWGLVDTFTDVEPSLGLVGASVALASGIVGKLVTEKQYKMTLIK